MGRTEENLRKAFAGESQARSKYTFFARKAREEGLEQIAAIFEGIRKLDERNLERYSWFAQCELP